MPSTPKDRPEAHKEDLASLKIDVRRMDQMQRRQDEWHQCDPSRSLTVYGPYRDGSHLHLRCPQDNIFRKWREEVACARSSGVRVALHQTVVVRDIDGPSKER